MGLGHEQSRADRGEYLVLDRASVRSGQLGALAATAGAGGRGPARQAYDLLSVMHAPATAFSGNGSVTLMPRDARVTPFMGQRMGFSFGDIQKLGSLYDCRQSSTPASGEDLLEALAIRTEALAAPATEGQCVCEDGWATEGLPRCATAENGWCCNPDGDARGPWCVTRGRCLGRVWDYCGARGDAARSVAPATRRGCRCRPARAGACARQETGFCCNPDGDPNGPWCRTESPCGGVDYDYCRPPGAGNATATL
uniref:Metalloendopeptidase n=1 Tax=Alexandrium catenella TaxID=2925 RepID=A0A7S1QGY9_ALECA